MPITPEQCRAARILAKINCNALAAGASIDVDAIRAFESEAVISVMGLGMRPQHALERLAGISARGKRLRRWHPTEIRPCQDEADSCWESEGGAAADDDVP